MTFKPGTYDAQKVTVVVKGFYITGFADGTFITAEKSEDDFSTTVGAQGEVAISESADKTGEIKLTLLQTSPSNSYLNKLAKNKEMVSVKIIDSNNKSTIAGGNYCRVKKPTGLKYSKEAESREWTIFVADYDQDIQ